MGYKLLPDDTKDYPLNDPTGFYTTVDITRILDVTMERLQDWIKRGFVVPLYALKSSPKSNREKKFFVRSQVRNIGLFKALTDLGIKRELAVVWVGAFHGLAASGGSYPDFAVFFLDDAGEVKRVSAQWVWGQLDPNQSDFDPDKDFDSIHIVNMRKLTRRIRDYSK